MDKDFGGGTEVSITKRLLQPSIEFTKLEQN